MKFLKQSKPTNCMAACVASLIGVPIEELPECFDGKTWDYLKQNAWLAMRGYARVDHKLPPDSMWPPTPDMLCILAGDSPRNPGTTRHAVIAKTLKFGDEGHEGGPFEVVHDPHESNAGILGEPYIVTWLFPLSRLYPFYR